MYHVDTKGLGPKRTQDCMNALRLLGYKAVDRIKGQDGYGKVEIKFGELRYVGVNSNNCIMLYDKPSNFVEGSIPVTHKKLLEIAKL